MHEHESPQNYHVGQTLYGTRELDRLLGLPPSMRSNQGWSATLADVKAPVSAAPLSTIGDHIPTGPSERWESKPWGTMPITTPRLAGGGQYSPTAYVPGGSYDGFQSVANCHIQPQILLDGERDRSTISRNHSYHDQGTTWNTTIPPQPANAGYMQQGGRPAASGAAPFVPMSTPSTSNSVSMNPPREPGPSTAPTWRSSEGRRSTFTRPYRSNPEGHIICDFVDAFGKGCGRIIHGNSDRHWITCHALTELKEIQHKTLKMREAVIITSKPIKKLIERHQLKCPLSCMEGPYPRVFSRKGHLRLHLEKCHKKHSQEQIERILCETSDFCWWRDTMDTLVAMGVLTEAL